MPRMEHITKHFDLEERRETMVTQWGRITIEEWLKREAERLTRAGAQARVGVDAKHKRKWIEVECLEVQP